MRFIGEEPMYLEPGSFRTIELTKENKMTGREHADPHKLKEREFEIGKDESWFANIKRMYDEYQHESLESIRRNRSLVDKYISDAQQYDNGRQNIANQALQNAVETANMVSKQAVRHSDLTIDHQWNKEVAEGAAEATILKAAAKIINEQK